MRIKYVSFIFKVRANRNSSETETEDKIRDQWTRDVQEHPGRAVRWSQNQTADNQSEEASEDYSDYSSDEWI